MVGGDPHGFHDQFENHRGFALVVCTLRNTGRGGFGQWAAASIGRVLSILEESGVKFTRVPPYHPASNGAAELSAQTAKKVLTKQVLDGTVTGQSPTELFLGRQIRNCFTLLKPNLNRVVDDQQLRQKEHHDEGRVKCREFKLTEVVLVSNWRRGVERWMPGRIAQVKGPRTYLVRYDLSTWTI